MLLKPFRIRNLPSSAHLQQGDGSLGQVVQLSAIQYDSTIKSNPAAALTYLDDDDGETITVGSSFELEQRLDDQVAPHLPAQASPLYAPQPDAPPHEPFHIFDIQDSAEILHTWRTYRVRGEEDDTPAPPSNQPLTVDNLDNVISSALQGLETHVQSFAEFLQEASTALREAAEQTRESTTIDGIFEGFRGIFAEIGKVGEAMVSAFEANGLPATVETGATQDSIPIHSTDPTASDDASTSSDPSKWYRDNGRTISKPPAVTFHEDGPTATSDSPLTQDTVQYSRLPDLPEGFDSNIIPVPEHVRSFWTTPSYPISRSRPSQDVAHRLADPQTTTTTSENDLSRDPAALANTQNSAHFSGFMRRDLPGGLPFDGTFQREAPKNLEHHAPMPQSRSILDLEDSDPDFAARFPSLMSLERSIGTSNSIPNALEVRNASNHKLPGSWPEQRPEVDETTLPTSEESSGAFFDRMTRNRDGIHSNPFMRRAMDLTPLHTRVEVRQNSGNPALGRSKTVTASNPAARLTRPFDPFIPDARDAHRAGVFRRAGTERHRRRPYTERFTGSGRMPWESFETGTQPRRPATMRSEPDLESRARQQEQQEQQELRGPHGPRGLQPVNDGRSSEVQRCVGQLKVMGYGDDKETDPHRLEICAVACKGRVEEAVEMLEEDKKAHARFWGDSSSSPDATQR